MIEIGYFCFNTGIVLISVGIPMLLIGVVVAMVNL